MGDIVDQECLVLTFFNVKIYMFRGSRINWLSTPLFWWKLLENYFSIQLFMEHLRYKLIQFLKLWLFSLVAQCERHITVWGLLAPKPNELCPGTKNKKQLQSYDYGLGYRVTNSMIPTHCLNHLNLWEPGISLFCF